ncbi:UNVERIFIED_CONTAM: hypothetical protein FKN15_023848 [Acipenser sinensis]
MDSVLLRELGIAGNMSADNSSLDPGDVTVPLRNLRNSVQRVRDRVRGITLRRIARDATVEVLEGISQLIEVILNTPLQRFSC